MGFAFGKFLSLFKDEVLKLLSHTDLGDYAQKLVRDAMNGASSRLYRYRNGTMVIETGTMDGSLARLMIKKVNVASDTKLWMLTQHTYPVLPSGGFAEEPSMIMRYMGKESVVFDVKHQTATWLKDPKGGSDIPTGKIFENYRAETPDVALQRYNSFCLTKFGAL